MRVRTRPRKLRRIVAGSASLIVFGGVAAGHFAAPAPAETVTLSGVFGVRPAYPVSLCPCQELRHPSLPWSVPATRRVIEQWAATPSQASPQTPKVAVTYSQSSVAAIDYLKEQERLGKPAVKVWAFGSPETPGNGKRDRKYTDATLPEGVEFVVRAYDSVADRPDRWGLLSAINASLSVHTSGYNDVDLDHPDHTYQVGGNTVRFYETKVLPILKPWDWALSDAEMERLDAKLRPRIEADYDRPWESVAEEQEWASTGKSSNETDIGTSLLRSDIQSDATTTDQTDTTSLTRRQRTDSSGGGSATSNESKPSSSVGSGSSDSAESGSVGVGADTGGDTE